MDPTQASRLALILATTCSAFALIRLFAIGVWRSLPLLYIFLIFQLGQNAFSLVTSPYSIVYSYFYVLSEPLNWILTIAMVWEMYRKAFAGYPGISGLARWMAYASAGLAIILCAALVLRVGPGMFVRRQYVSQYVSFWEQCVFFTLSAFIFLMMFLLSRYPIQLQYNLVIYIIVFAVNFFGGFLLLSVANPQSTAAQIWRNASLYLLNSICFASWGIFLSRRSENVSIVVRPPRDGGEGDRLLQQLDMLNNVLIKSGRR